MAYHPSTKSLRAFEAAARLGSIKAAADCLHITASAVSRRIQTLEEELGQALFVRDMQGITPTEAGRHYAEQLRAIFKSLDQATDALRKKARRRLTVIGPAAVIQPCMDNLDSIEGILPDIDLEFHTVALSNTSHPALSDADVAFFFGKGKWDGWTTRAVTSRTQIAPLCVPDLLENGMPLSTEALADHTWIMPVTFEDSWALWFDALGTPMPTPKRMMKVADAPTAAQLARKGAGIAMLSGFGGMPNFYVLARQLAPAHAFHAFAHDYGIHVGHRSGEDNPDSDRFIDWFFGHVWNHAALQRWLANQK